MTELKRIDDGFYVAAQLAPGDITRAAAAGIRTIINNRPDAELSVEMRSEEARVAAEAAGLAYVYLPVPTGGMTGEHVQAMRAATAAHDGPFLAYCRSGTRSCHLWAFATVPERGVEAVIDAAAQAGYDLAPAAPALAHTAAG